MYYNTEYQTENRTLDLSTPPRFCYAGACDLEIENGNKWSNQVILYKKSSRNYESISYTIIVHCVCIIFFLTPDMFCKCYEALFSEVIFNSGIL